MPERENKLVHLFPTGWSAEQKRLVIVEMRSMTYDGPLDTPEKNVYELELLVGASAHAVIYDWLSQNASRQPWDCWPRIVGYESQGLQGAQRQPLALNITFRSVEKRAAFQEFWNAYKDTQNAD